MTLSRRKFPSLWHITAYSLIAAASLLRLIYFIAYCPLDLAPDEAHYWDWSRHLDWSYYSKGPIVALLIHLSCSLTGPFFLDLCSSEMPAVRLPALLCGGLLLAALHSLTMQVYNCPKLALGVVAVALTMPVLAAGASIMTIDAPFTCLWAWSLVLVHRAIFNESLSCWIGAGLLIALGVLTKPNMVLFPPLVGLFLLVTPAMFPLLLQRGFWVMTSLGALGGLPILWWNVQHDWVTLRHTQGHAGLDKTHGDIWLGPIVYLGTQFALLLGYWFSVWVCAIWTHRPWYDERPSLGFLWCMSVPVFVFFWLFSLKNGGGEPNWPITAYIAGVVLAAGWLARQLDSPSTWYRRLAWSFVIAWSAMGLGLTLIVHESQSAYPLLATLTSASPESMPMRRLDPTCRLRGWLTLAKAVDALRDKLAYEEAEIVLASTTWTIPGELGFYCQGHPQAYCLGSALGERHSQYDLWHPNPIADPSTFRGKKFLIVGDSSPALTAAFESLEPAGEVSHEESGQRIAHWNIYLGRGFQGFTSSAANRY